MSETAGLPLGQLPMRPECVALGQAWTHIETRDRARDAGFHRHYVKPIELEELKDLLDCDTLDPLY